MKNVKTYLSQGNCASWWLFGLLALSVLLSSILFHHFVFLGSMPLGFWQYLVTKLSVAILIGSLVLATKNKWWIVGIICLLSVWVSANWIYYRANGLFLSWAVIRMAGNLRGFTDSIGGLVDGRLVVILLPFIFLLCFLPFFPSRGKRLWGAFAVTVGVSVFLSMAGSLMIHTLRQERGYDDGELSWRRVLPLYVNEQRMVQDWECEYSMVREHSIIAYLPMSIIYDIKMNTLVSQTYTELTEEEKTLMSQLFCEPKEAIHPTSNLVIILVESLESWALNMEIAMPRIHEWMESTPCFYADHMKSQIRFGMSGDGQMIVNTGLLPIESGVACILYGANTFPNLAHSYEEGVVFSPSKGTWNQNVVTYSYGYTDLVEPPYIQTISWTDADVFAQASQRLSALQEPFCAQVITVASHLPFNRVEGELAGLPAQLPPDQRRYLTCLHYTDSCIGAFIDSMREKGLYENTTFVITGDHTIFHSKETDYLPFLVFSPYIRVNRRTHEACYQMDIFPTILHATGCEEESWRGLGINLLDTVDGSRPITIQEAYKLSDKLIRSNYFN